MRKKLLLMLLGVLMALPAFARDFSYEYEGQTLTYTVVSEEDKTVKTKEGWSLGSNNYYSGNDVSGDLIIPEIAKDGDVEYTVFQIGYAAFSRCSGLTSVTIPNSVTSIGEGAFFGCSILTSVTIGNSVESIGESAFSGCSRLTEAEFGSIEQLCSIKFGYNGANPLSYAQNLYINGEEIKDLVIPESVKSIGYDAFSGCTGLTSVTIGNSVESIGSYAFNGCTGLTSVIIGNSVTSIGYSAFVGCTGLTSVTIPNSVTEIGEKAFSGCSGLKNIAISDGTETLSFSLKVFYGVKVENLYLGRDFKCTSSNSYDGPFYGKNSLKELTIGESVTSIGKEAFNGCRGLTSVIIGNSVKSIGNRAFYGCTGLTSVTIPNSVISIGANAFDGCSGLTEVKTLNEQPASISADAFEGLYDTALLIIPDGTVNKYLCTTWGKFNNIRQSGSDKLISIYSDDVLKYRLIPALTDDENNMAVIISGDYYGEISIPERFAYESESGETERYYVTGIGYNAFANSNISKIEFNSRIDLKTIGEGAFMNCNDLKEISIPNTVETIGDYAFYGCSGLTSVTIPNSVTSIGKSAFFRCSGLTSVTIGNSVKSIGDDAFYGCSGLTKVTIPNSVESIGNYAFYGCSGLTSVTIGNSVTSIGNLAFFGCRGLTSVTIPNSVTSIGEEAFSGCSGLTSVTIPNSVESIGNYAFSNCSDLNSVTIPNSVKSIGNYAFSGCSILTSVTIGNSVESIGESAFSGCSRLTEAEFGSIEQLCGIEFGNYDANPLYYAHNLYINGEEIKDLVIPESVTSIGDCAFQYCSRLTSVTIGNSVESIGNDAFYNCKFTQITIPASVEYIGTNAIPATEVIISDSTNPIELDSKSFYNNLTSLYWGRSLDNFNIPVSSLQTLKIGNIVEEIPAGLFSGCSTITSLSLGSSLTTIGENAFNGCTGLSEVVISPAVETIGASAFAGCSKVSSIIMGANVKTIGEKAFDGCPAETVYITAQTPPTAPNNTFSNYSGKLYLQGEDAIDAYYDAFTCWDRFDSYQMVEPEAIEMSKNNIVGRPGEKMQLYASLKPADVTLPQIFWYSTNPEIATVDNNGLVTFVGEMQTDTRASECKIIAESLYADGPVAEVSVSTDFIMVTSLSFKQSSYAAEVGETLDLNDEVVIMPADATDKTLTWTSSDESVATVSDGVVTVLAEGFCEITATTTDGSNLSAVCSIDISVGIEGIMVADAQCDVYNINGVLLMREATLGEVSSLAPGIYIIRQGSVVKKVVVK